MPRNLLIRSDHFPYHVTGRTNNKEPFPIALNYVWKIMTDELYVIAARDEIEIQAFVLMPNHFHLVITTPSQDLGLAMRELMRTTTKKINGYSNKSGHVFGGPYFRSIITATDYFSHVLKYVYRNPVKAGISNRVEEYEFSTANGLFETGRLPFPIHFSRIGLEVNLPDINKPDAWLDWLNRPFPNEIEKLIQKSLRKKVIKEIVNRDNRRKYPELSQLI